MRRSRWIALCLRQMPLGATFAPRMLVSRSTLLWRTPVRGYLIVSSYIIFRCPACSNTVAQHQARKILGIDVQIGLSGTECFFCFLRFHSFVSYSCFETQVKGRCEPCQIRCVLEIVTALNQSDVKSVADQVFKTTASLFFPSVKSLSEATQDAILKSWKLSGLWSQKFFFWRKLCTIKPEGLAYA